MRWIRKNSASFILVYTLLAKYEILLKYFSYSSSYYYYYNKFKSEEFQRIKIIIYDDQ